jgi:hypothetical protein
VQVPSRRWMASGGAAQFGGRRAPILARRALTLARRASVGLAPMFRRPLAAGARLPRYSLIPPSGEGRGSVLLSCYGEPLDAAQDGLDRQWAASATVWPVPGRCGCGAP